MRLLRWMFVLCLLLPATLSAHASETAAEHAANVYAQQELDAAPRNGNIPDYSLPPDKLAKAVHLNTVRDTMHFADELWGIVSLLLLLGFGVIAWMRNVAVKLGGVRILQIIIFPYSFLVMTLLVDLIPAGIVFWLHPLKTVALFLQLIFLLGAAVVVFIYRRQLRAASYWWVEGHIFVILYVIAATLLSLPLDLYRQHLGLKYNLSVQSWASWFGDQGKTLLLSVIGTALIALLVMWIIHEFPRRWWFAFWLCTIPIILFAIFVAPYVNLLYDKFELLEKTNPELVARLEKVVEKGHMNIPPDRMFLMKASAKVTTLNAYVTGFGSSKRVVVWDTSLQKGTPDEVLFIFGHESGHYVLHHITLGVAEAIVGLFVLLWLGYYFVQIAIARFGRRWGVSSQSDWAAFAVLLLAFSVFGLISEPVQNGLSRMDEHAADVYGQEAIHGLVADPQATAQGAFDVLGESSLVDPNPSQFIEFWTYSHPAIGRRAAFAHAYNPWAPGMEPKYFTK